MSGFGVYMRARTPMHRLDPRAKAVAALLFFAAAFAAHDALGLALLAVAALAVLLASGGLGAGIRAARGFVWLALFVFVFDALCVSGGELWWQAGPFSLSSYGLCFAVESIVRFACVLLATSALMRTTSPVQLTDASTSLLSPLRRLGAPVDDCAQAIGMALRFVPTLSREMLRIRAAQTSRAGAADDVAGTPCAALKAQVPLVTALFSGAFRRSATLALAIANREYGLHGRRSCMRGYRLGAADFAALFAVTLLLVACVLL